MIINRRPLRKSLGSRTDRRRLTKSNKGNKPLPKVLLRELVAAEMKRRGIQ